jgi:hypothetical protein
MSLLLGTVKERLVGVTERTRPGILEQPIEYPIFNAKRQPARRCIETSRLARKMAVWNRSSRPEDGCLESQLLTKSGSDTRAQEARASDRD